MQIQGLEAAHAAAGETRGPPTQSVATEPMGSVTPDMGGSVLESALARIDAAGAAGSAATPDTPAPGQVDAAHALSRQRSVSVLGQGR